jgi:D-3-phosphoglycerate dehydrogenase / 2-oxoglutarate reductase
MNTPGQNSNAVAELAAGMMVYYVRNFFNGKSGTELLGKTLGIHAYGYVGKNVARIARGFGMIIYAYDPFIPKEVIEKDGVKWVSSAEELYSKCNFVSLHIPANSQTKLSINFSLLSVMPVPACLVNTARAEVINENDLLRMFEERKDFSYLSDVESLNKAELELKFKGRFFFTPKKMGAQTEEANINAGIAAARQIVNFLKNGDRTFQVNK